MKKITLLFFIIATSFSFAQVGISENFDAGTPAGWTDTYANTATGACAGNSEQDNIWSSSTTGNLTSPNQVGLSNGTDLTVSFDYKIVEYNFSNPIVAQGAGWGTADLQYSTDDGATWTSVLTIDDSNHVTANTCANMIVVIPAASLPAASDVKLQIANVWALGDYYFYIDDFNATQVVSNPPNCDSVLAETVDVSIAGDISWSGATGIPTGYNLTVGTTMGGSEVLTTTDVLNVTSYNLGTLAYSTPYYVTIEPYNANGSATGCSEQTFTTEDVPPVGTDCFNPIIATIESDCSTATPYTIDYATATDLGAAGSCDTTTGNTGAWFQFTAPASGGVTVNASDSNEIVILDACGGTEVICNSTASTSHEIAGLTSGNTYYLAVWKDSATTGTTDVCLEEFTPPMPPANDECAAAIGLTVNTDYGCGVVTSGTTVGATASAEDATGTSGTPNTDVWYSFTATATDHRIELQNVVNQGGGTSTSTDMGMTLYDATTGCASLVFVGTSDPNTYNVTGLTIGINYYVRVYGWATGIQNNNFDICVGRQSTDTLDYYNVQWPGSGTITDGDGYNVYAQAYESGLTDASATPAAGIEAWIGYSTIDTDPSGTGWTWVTAPTNPGYDFSQSNDEFILDLDASVGVGTYYYASRFSLNTGPYTYGGFDTGGGDGVWDGTVDVSGVLTVNAPTCEVPTALAAANITATTADISWTAPTVGTPVGYNWEIQPDGVAQGTAGAITGNVVAAMDTAAGLTDSTAYDLFVQTDCGGGDLSTWAGPYNFTTACAVVTTFPSTTDFSTNPSTCWSEAGAGEVVDGPTGTTSDWRAGRAYTDASANLVNSNAMNLYSNTDREWLMSPVYDIPVGVAHSLVLNIAITNWTSSGTSSATDTDTMGSDDEVQLLQSVDGGTTWTNITTWNVANQPAVTGTEYIADLTAVSGNVQFAIWASDSTVDDAEDYDFHVGAFTVLDSASLSTDEVSFQGFKYFPNPVEGTLSLRAQDNMQNVAVYNMLGQEVINISPNTMSNDLDMSALSRGTYFVKISINGAVENFKIIKE